MLIPKVSSLAALDPAVRRAVGLMPAVLFTDARDAASGCGDAAAWAHVAAGSDGSDVRALLNDGLSVAVLAGSGDDVQAAGGIDRARVALRYADGAADAASVVERARTDGIQRGGAVILALTAAQIAAATAPAAGGEASALGVLVRAAERQALGSAGPVRVAVEADGAWTMELLARVGACGASAVVDAAQLAVEGGGSEGRLEIGAAVVAASGLASDRADGLIPTVVVDEQRVCLGVAYSSAASLGAALAAGEGVYWSRKRGLWRKGLTSGATQTLVGVAVDCDADTLCFRVRQAAGFCHRNTRTCFGPSAGIARLAQTVADRRASAPAGSYTRRLFDDADLLRAKLLEEAGELADADDAASVAFEAADVLYFALVKCAAHGVSLADVERSLDRKHLRVERRAGDAKPGALKPAPASRSSGPPPPPRAAAGQNRPALVLRRLADAGAARRAAAAPAGGLARDHAPRAPHCRRRARARRRRRAGADCKVRRRAHGHRRAPRALRRARTAARRARRHRPGLRQRAHLPPRAAAARASCRDHARRHVPPLLAPHRARGPVRAWRLGRAAVDRADAGRAGAGGWVPRDSAGHAAARRRLRRARGSVCRRQGRRRRHRQGRRRAGRGRAGLRHRVRAQGRQDLRPRQPVRHCRQDAGPERPRRHGGH
ncbi:trifunctional histidinol dehydrogenase [Coemansia sp. RSA 2322]|nr:trifunctional histidinol dehydrogenase [Coemansia sp. RSA 2322]